MRHGVGRQAWQQSGVNETSHREETSTGKQPVAHGRCGISSCLLSGQRQAASQATSAPPQLNQAPDQSKTTSKHIVFEPNQVLIPLSTSS